jgi:hypothetical protein
MSSKTFFAKLFENMFSSLQFYVNLKNSSLLFFLTQTYVFISSYIIPSSFDSYIFFIFTISKTILISG